MLTKNEITALNLSPTKKDFVQIWNELLEVSSRLSERWDPTSTNESDPGIVILKALTGIADKLNYNIDKNTLEAFMPTAAQEESMRKLCDMLGYNMKYYRSAETTVTFKYYNAEPEADEDDVLEQGLEIPKFTVLSNSDQDINYFTTNQSSILISKTTPRVDAIPCMEGQLVKCESTADNNVITASQISDNNRFYLPEYRIAENGMFIYNVIGGQAGGDRWVKVDNLNIQPRGSRVFKFGYDSYESRPYVEFPEDWSSLINDGLFVYYTRTSGANGNISPRILTQFEAPSTQGWDKVALASFSIENSFAATTGADIETIDQAYNNFKKTIGTFETLVTCRDYMNKIYTLTDETSGKFLVSNALVTDIRSDLNRAVTICSCDDAGIFYKETALLEDNRTSNSIFTTTINEVVSEPIEEIEETISTTTKPVYSEHSHHKGGGSNEVTHWHLDDNINFPLFDFEVVNDSGFDNTKDGEVLDTDDEGNPSSHWLIKQDGTTFTTKWPIVRSTTTTITTEKTKTVNNTTTTTEKIETSIPAINHFDLVLYPFKSYTQIKNNVKAIKDVYDSSFKYSQAGFNNIKSILTEPTSTVKTIAHNIIAPRENDILSINNYLRLNAIISTTSKVTSEESDLLIDKIKIALANAFNMRELDFSEEIPFDSILNVIKNTDNRISTISLAEPALYTTFSVLDGFDNLGSPILKEYAVASEWLSEDYANSTDRFEYLNDNTYTFDTAKAREIYNRLAVRNILAGRVPLFKYNTTFAPSFAEAPYRVTEEVTSADIPAGVVEKLTVTQADPVKIYNYNEIVYTAQRINDETKYTKTYVPEDYINNVITKDADDSKIVELTTRCKIKSTTIPSQISDVTLAEGEFVKFRAPNFITKKTYPAYVNYHLALNKELLNEAHYAEADTLYNLLNGETDTGKSADDKRQEVLSYFADKQLKKTFKLVQTIKKINSKKTTASALRETIKNRSSSIVVDNPSGVNSSEDINVEAILLNSGFIKLADTNAVVRWAPAEGEQAPNSSGPNITIPPIDLGNSSFITSIDVLTKIQAKVDEYLLSLPEAELPTNCTWAIDYTFEYVPFDTATFKAWESFVSEKGVSIFGFAPQAEYTSVLWYLFDTYSYNVGKYVLDNSAKLLKLSANTVNSLAEDRLKAVYIAKDLGVDLKPNFIGNDEEYMLKANEYLFIEYTPSSTTEEGTTQTQSAVREVYEEGTIIRPSGFIDGIKDSSKQMESGSATYKTVDFETATGAKPGISMYSLGASEQIEIRELAHVLLDRQTLPDEAVIYIYKNFNGCEALESTNTVDAAGKRKYTLKDGEYIFYTDKNKAEFAYFSAGTEVTLTGNIIIPEFESIDLSLIFDNGIDEIPWSRIYFSGEDSINFQEFQYITLGVGDTLNTLMLVSEDLSDEYCLDENWKKCNDVTYTTAGEAKPVSLAKINVTQSGLSDDNGWEACSILELSTSPNKTQTLRKTEAVDTSISLYKGHNSGTSDDTPFLTISAVGSSDKYISAAPISFKTNLPCTSSSSKLNISDIYLNPNKLNSFELKVFSDQIPTIVKTQPGILAPVTTNQDIIDITKWPSEETDSLTAKIYGELWSRVELSKLKVESDEASFDKALKLPVCLLPNTYGIFSVYLNHSVDLPTTNTWIELLPGVDTDNITLLNVEPDQIEWNQPIEEDSSRKQLLLKQGINCIRVNQTCDLFIKTTANDGILLFDDLRLVDCQPVQYVEDGCLVVKETQGLNLDQLGYLDVTSTTTSNSFDMQLRKKLKEDYTKEALSAITDIENTTIATLTAVIDELKPTEAKLKILVDFLKRACDEIPKLGQLDTNIAEETLIKLFIKYKELYEDIAKETSLHDALVANRDIDQLEQQLVTLLADSGDLETVKQELFKVLDELDQNIKNNISIFSSGTLTKGEILDDFEATAKSSDKQLINDLKLASIKELNSEYSNKLTVLSTALSAVTDDEAQVSLLALLEDLYLTQHTELVSQINELLETSQESLQNTISTALTLASGTNNEVDYPALYATLSELKAQLAITGINDLLDKLERVLASNMTNNEKYLKIVALVTELNQIIANSEVTDDINYVSIAQAVDSLMTVVQGKITAGSKAADQSILDSIENLNENIVTAYLNKIAELLAQLQATLLELNDDYKNKVATLKQTENESVQAILEMLKLYTATKEAQMATVNAFGSGESFNIQKEYLCLPYGVVAVLAVWPKYMQQDFVIGTNSLHKSILDVLNDPEVTEELSINDVFYTQSPAKTLRQILAKAADLEAFQSLFIQAKKAMSVKTQTISRKEFINQIGLLTSNSMMLKEAMESISEVDDDKLLVLRQLIDELRSTPTVTERQQLINSLEVALNEAIKVDTQLLEICAKVLCSSILSFDVTTLDAEDDTGFYKRLADYINDILTAEDTGILALIDVNDESGDTFISSVITKFTEEIYDYLYYAQRVCSDILSAIDQADFSSFNYWDVIMLTDNFADGEDLNKSSTLLTANYLAILQKIKPALDTQQQLIAAKASKLLSILQDDNLAIAWQDSDYNWRDAFGGYYYRYNKGTWLASTDWSQTDLLNTDAAWFNETGYWRNSSGEFVKVILKRKLLEDGSGIWKDLNDTEISLKDDIYWLTTDDQVIILDNSDISDILESLLMKVHELGKFNTITPEAKTTYSIWCLEEQLLAELRKLDKNREFYYNVPIESHVAINFNEHDKKLNTLMNPAVNYDINNINNNFVISKLDIDYITSGFRVARSSRLN